MKNKPPVIIVTICDDSSMEVDESFVESLEVRAGRELPTTINKTQPENQLETAAIPVTNDTLYTAGDAETSLSHIEAPDFVPSPVNSSPNSDNPVDVFEEALTITNFEVITGHDVHSCVTLKSDFVPRSVSNLILNDQNFADDAESLTPKAEEQQQFFNSFKTHAVSTPNYDNQVIPRLSLIEMKVSPVNAVENVANENHVSSPAGNTMGGVLNDLQRTIKVEVESPKITTNEHTIRTLLNKSITPVIAGNVTIVPSTTESLINVEATSALHEIQVANEGCNISTKSLLDSTLLETTYNETTNKNNVKGRTLLNDSSLNSDVQDSLNVMSHQHQKRQSISRIIVNPNLTDPEDRCPLRKLSSNKRQQQQQEEVSEENKENAPQARQKFDLSFFSDSPSRPRRARNSVLQLFDPLYESILDTTNTEAPVQHRLSLISEDQSQPQSVGVHADVLNQLRESLAYEGELEDLVTAVLTIRAAMETAIQDRMSVDQELNRLKLEVNQLQQERAALELELHQKDEVILKTQGEAQKKANQYLLEIKQLQDKLNEINEQNNNEEVKVLRDKIAMLKERDGELNEKIKALKDTVDQYETTLSRIVPESEKLKEEHDTAKNHLSTLEMSFADLHTKYERCKDIIGGFKSNEEALKESLERTHQMVRKYEERYDTLKAHAKAQLDKANKDLAGAKEKHAQEVNKLCALLKRLEIKNGSVQQALEQKTKECTALAALCEEISGPMPR